MKVIASTPRGKLLAEAYQVALWNWAQVANLPASEPDDDFAELALYVAGQALSMSKSEVVKLRDAASILDPRVAGIPKRRELACIEILKFVDSDSTNYEGLISDMLRLSELRAPHRQHRPLEDDWVNKTLRRAETAVTMLRQDKKRDRLLSVNALLGQFGLAVDEYTRAERTGWTPQQRKDKQHRLESIWRRAKKIRACTNTEQGGSPGA